jgi:hypothetical protein
MMTIAPTIPDLSAITSVTGLQNATSDSVIARLSTGTFLDPNGSPPVGSGPATIVDLSDQAKATLAKDAKDQVAAKKLEAQVSKSRTDSLNHSDDKKASDRSIFDQIHDIGRELKTSDSSSSAAGDVTAGIPIWQQVGSADNIAILQAGAKLYNQSQAMQDLAKNGGQFASPTEGHVVSDDVLFVFAMHSEVARSISDLQDKGMTDQAQALSDALQNGTLKFQKASDVPDLNMNSWMIHFADAGGGGEMGSSSVKPTGTTKAAIEGGHALAVNMGDRGDFYVTW